MFCVSVCACLRARILECMHVSVGAWARPCDCVRVALFIQHAKRMLDLVCGFFASNYSTLFHKLHNFEKKMLLGINCAFCFAPELLFETFLILRRIQRVIVINVKTSS
jgi:hypothetical protein